MTKVDIRRLDSVTKNDTTATAQINDNFTALQEAIENTLSRDGTGPNYMDADLDMNSYRIINSSDPVEDNDIVNLRYVEERIGGAIDAANSASASASQAASSAQSALVSSTEAINTLRNAENTINQATELLSETQEYVDNAKLDINNTRDEAVNTINTTSSTAVSTIETTVDNAKSDINTTIDEAQMNLSDTIEQAVEDVKTVAVAAAEEVIADAGAQATQVATDNINAYVTNNVTPTLDSAISTINTTKDEAVNELSSVLAADKSTLEAYVDSTNANATIADNAATVSRTWATGTDEEVQAIEDDEHSSRTYANFAMALANAAEDVPVLESTLLATNVIQGEPWAGGEVTTPLVLVSDDNHPIAIRGMAGASATGYQIIDSNGLGESDFEHYATGDRYGTRITNKNNTSRTTSNIDFYQSNAGRSVLDLSEVQTILAPALLGAMYPVGSIYITTNATCPIADLGVGTWELVAEDRVLQGAGTRGAVGTELAESLPNITGSFESGWNATTGEAKQESTGAFTSTYKSLQQSIYSRAERTYENYINDFNASLSSSTYQDDAPVQQDAYLINIFRRIQ